MHVVLLLLSLTCWISASENEECGGCLLYPDTNFAECSDTNKTEIPTCVPNDIKRLHLLFNADLVSNSNLSRFQSLEVLQIFGMPSLDLPRDLLRGLESLTSLYIRFSDVSEIPAGFFNHTPSLTHLDLSSNSFRSIPADLFDGLPDVNYVSLANNSLETLEPLTFSSLHQLLWLDLYDNPWKCDCKLKEEISRLHRAQVVMGDVQCFQPVRLKGITLERLVHKMSCMDSSPSQMAIYK